MKILFLVLSLVVFATNNSIASTEIGFWKDKGVRVAFKSDKDQWESSLHENKNSKDLEAAPPKYAKPEQWTIFFDGKTYGTISTKPFLSYSTYSENGLQLISSKEPKLKFRKKNINFSDLSGGSMRPVLVTTFDKIQDPDQWKSDKAEDKVDTDIFADLKKRLKDKVFFCSDENCDSESKRDIKESEVKPQYSYKDKAGNKLIAVNLKFAASAYAYCETQGDECISERFWYFKDTKGKSKFLAKAAALIETADANNDGISEMFFWFSGYNEDGYILIDGKSHKTTTSFWTYH